MSEKQEHRRRFNMRYEYVKAMEAWLAVEPSMIRFIKWHKWARRRPKRGY